MSAWTGSLNSLLFQCLFPLTPQKEVTTFPLKPQKFPQRRFLPSDDSLSVCVGPMGPSSVGFLASSTHSAGPQMQRSRAVEYIIVNMVNATAVTFWNSFDEYLDPWKFELPDFKTVGRYKAFCTYRCIEIRYSNTNCAKRENKDRSRN